MIKSDFTTRVWFWTCVFTLCDQNVSYFKLKNLKHGIIDHYSLLFAQNNLMKQPHFVDCCWLKNKNNRKNKMAELATPADSFLLILSSKFSKFKTRNSFNANFFFGPKAYVLTVLDCISFRKKWKSINFEEDFDKFWPKSCKKINMMRFLAWRKTF